MRLLNVSAGTIQTVRIGSEAIRTGHVKSPVEEPWMIAETGVPGDQRAVHPDTLYAFCRAAYCHWGAQLGVDPTSWPDGFFGENLTFEDFDEGDLRIGDVFALGDEVRLYVAGARNPCNKLVWRLSQPPTFQKVFATSRRAGVYLGVEAPGRVRPGDMLTRIKHDPAMPSVAEVSSFMIGREAPPLAPLRRLLGYERLSPTNRLLLGAKLDAAERAADAVEGRWRGWRPFTIVDIVEEAPSIRSVELMALDGQPLCLAKPGQFVAVRLDDLEGGVATRCWSLSRFDDKPSTYRLTVREQGGAGSRRLHLLERGDIVSLHSPAGDFTLNRGSFRPVVLVAAGIGITPLKAMLDAQLARPDPPPVKMIYGGRDPASMAFREELEALARTHPAFDLTMAYSRASVAGAHEGRITPKLVIDELQDLRIVVAGHSHPVPWYETDIYLCGPDELCREISAHLVANGANADRVFQELFTAPPTVVTDVERASVVFTRSGVSVEWLAADDLSLLELAEEIGLDVPSSCRAGSCLSCRSGLMDGRVTAELCDGTFLPCISRPLTSHVTINL